ncbi:MAG TPA: PH domain-containing protein [Allosphingosinicella sp.]|nr:PH domain-containing protein [Allosphingosinicella sp.]
MANGMRQLHPNHLTLLRVRGAIFALAFVAVAALLDATLVGEIGLRFGVATGGAAALGVALALWLPGRRYRAWAWRMDEDELRIASGVLVRSDTIVPFGRVQHIDILRGPLQRHYGLGSLVLHTAGTRSAAILLPGLEVAEAERMRDHVRARIREDLV